MKKCFILAAVLVLALCGCGNRNNNNNQPEETAQTVGQEAPAALQPVYVLSDQLGTRFLLQEHFNDAVEPQPKAGLENYKYVIYDDKYYPVSFKGVQLGNREKDSGRDTYYNFDNLSGWVYAMAQGRLLENPEDEYDAIWGAALLVDENYKNSAKILELKNREKGATKIVALSQELNKAFVNKYGRKIVSSCASAVFGDNSEFQLVNVQFENKGDDALGVSALVENGEIKAVKEFPAKYDEMSTWRVDDEGEFYGLWAHLVVLENGVLTLYTSNSGEESANYQSYVLEGDKLVEGDISASYYHFPDDSFDMEGQDDTGTAQCDMQQIWKQIEKMPLDEEAENESSFTIEPNRISYELGVYQHRDREIMSFYEDPATFRVFDVYNYVNIYDDEIQSESHQIKEYLFRDGKLTGCELQNELVNYKKAYFSDNDLVVVDEQGQETSFFWNGERMEKRD